MADAGDALREVENRVREHMFAKGINSFRSVKRACQRADFSGNNKLDRREFDEVLRAVGVFLSSQDIGLLFRVYDVDGDGSITYDEFLTVLKGELNPTRQALVDKAFDVLDKDGSGVVNIADLKGVFNTTQHPDVKEGKKTEDEVFAEFLEGFEGMRGDADGNVTRDEFNDYYTEISASIPLDAYFVTMMENAWMISLDDTPAHSKEVSRFVKMVKDKIEERTHGSESPCHALQRIFRFFDKDHTGQLAMDEFGSAMLRLGIPVERKLVGDVFASFDTDGSGTLRYEEFSSAIFTEDEGAMSSTSFM